MLWNDAFHSLVISLVRDSGQDKEYDLRSSVFRMSQSAVTFTMDIAQ